eukprot:CAMPEP_0172526624 /NCGR_PEP_ID=MMETSP1067-20121228/1485_1 /TAXON_ID=265564 ORGANISM="Thalassiosira punctigera, Strain Tpunct2005C2" /NCGR_SAMPLE_ID=MMETSP1067 /ASSEMBLY_ACC=CAM_ASM_000444 /LENGTH=129 /DNA_ID=CAMNT_0013310163 /DNA_START=9 /DNA_END=398 /DNA_ORIENTATION=-
MTKRLACALALCLAAAADVAAFSARHLPLPPARTPVALRSSAETATTDAAVEDDADDDVTCYVVNDEEIVTEGEKPHVVCTSEPDDYAWFNGVDPKNMREARGEEEDAELCVEGESFRGKPEWECGSEE